MMSHRLVRVSTWSWLLLACGAGAACSAGSPAPAAPIVAAPDPVAPPPCEDVAPAPVRIDAEPFAAAELAPGPAAPRPQLVLDDAVIAGESVRAAIALADVPLQLDKVELRGDGVTLDVDRFNRDEITGAPRERQIRIAPLAFELTAPTPGPAAVEARIWRDGTAWAMRYPLEVAARPPSRCPAPAPVELSVALAGEPGQDPPRARLWFTRPPRAGVTSLLHVELRPPASREGWGVLYVTRFVPTASAALGIPAPPDGKVGKLRPRWVGERRITFDLPITPAEPGEVPLEAQVQLYLCSQEECFEDRPFTLTTRVPVAPPAD